MLLLEADGALSAVTLLEELLRRHPGDYGTAVLRTLQRRVRRWRAMHGPEREVMFAKEHPPGLSRVGVIRPPGVGIFRPLEVAPKGISKRPVNGLILPRLWMVSGGSFSAPVRPSDHGRTARRVRGNRRCGAADRWSPRPTSG